MKYKVVLTTPTAVVPVESGVSVHTDGNRLYFKAARPMTARIYTITGAMAQQLALSEGEKYVTLSRGTYIIMLSDGTTQKVYIK